MSSYALLEICGLFFILKFVAKNMFAKFWANYAIAAFDAVYGFIQYFCSKLVLLTFGH